MRFFMRANNEYMTVYSPETAKELCELISGGMSLTKACEQICVHRNTAINWIVTRPEFREMYEIARIARLELAEETMEDRIESSRGSSEELTRLKLWLENKRWFMGKLNPRKYSDRMTLAGDKDNPLTVTLANELDARIAARVAVKTIDHEPSNPMPLIGAPVSDSND